MPETKPGEDIERGLRRDADELDERIDRLGDHIDEARRQAQARQEEGRPFEDAAGDWEDTEPAESTGEDPAAFDDPDDDEDDDEET